MSETGSPTTVVQPKILRKMLIRSVVLLFVIAFVTLLFNLLKQNSGDLKGNAKTDSHDMLAMIEFTRNGSEVVIQKPDGTMIRDSGYKTGAADRDPVWRPDGNFLFFVSDRIKEPQSVIRNVHVHRWNPEESTSEVRTQGARSRGTPSFSVGDVLDNKSLMLTSGGEVIELDPKERSSRSVLPPREKGVSTTDGGDNARGTESAFAAAYKQLGSSFRTAKWAKGRSWIVAVMRTDEGENLIVQNLSPTKEGKLSPPQPIMSGTRIDFDICPSTGDLVFAVIDFRWTGDPPKEMVVNGKATRPFNHYVGMWNFGDKPPTPIAISNDNKVGFSQPVFSPDGKTVAMVAGSYEGDGVIKGISLVKMPAKESGASEGAVITRGEIRDPTWHPSGDRLAFVRKDSEGMRTIYSCKPDGTEEKNLTAGKGNFGKPAYSPQKK